MDLSFYESLHFHLCKWGCTAMRQFYKRASVPNITSRHCSNMMERLLRVMLNLNSQIIFWSNVCFLQLHFYIHIVIVCSCTYIFCGCRFLQQYFNYTLSLFAVALIHSTGCRFLQHDSISVIYCYCLQLHILWVQIPATIFPYTFCKCLQLYILWF